jgi:tRNA dimethylallyltransferase
LIVIIGPTAIGKTKIAIELAQELQTLIISADSRQIYKELRIGTASPTTEELLKAKHLFIAEKSILEYYSAGIYELEVLDALKTIYKEKQTAILTGGSGLYIDAVCKGIDELPDVDMDIRNSLINQLEKEGIESLRFDLQRLDPEHYKVVDLNNPKRILKALEVCIQTGKTYTSLLTKPQKIRDFRIIKIGLERERAELFERIDKRVDLMFEQGLLDEARSLYKFKHLNALNTVGYKEIFDYFDHKHDLNEAIRLIKRNSRRYAKRQITWFKRDEEIRWFHPDQITCILKYILESIK